MIDIRRYIYMASYGDRGYYLGGFSNSYYSGVDGWTYGRVIENNLLYLEEPQLRLLLESYLGGLEEWRGSVPIGSPRVFMDITLPCDRTIHRCSSLHPALLIRNGHFYALVITPGAFISVRK